MIELSEPTYQCPGEAYTISRAVHLGRLGAFDARCRGCSHRHDTGCLHLSVVEQLQASWQRDHPPLFDEEGAAGLLGESLNADTARRLASAFAAILVGRTAPGTPSVVVAGDGRPASAELVAAASEGLRWSGCQVIETPSATSASLLFTQAQYQADGALLVGNAAGTPRMASVRCFGPGGRPLAAHAIGEERSLSELQRHYEAGPSRAARRSGPWRRGSAEAEYLTHLSGRFHALRPLKFRWETSCAPVRRYLNQLLTHVACRPVSPAEAAELPIGSCHFWIWIDGDGERCQVSDETGQAVPSHALLRLLATFLIQSPGETVIVEEETPASTVHGLEQCGARVIRSSASRSVMHRALCEHQALLGGGPSGRFWFRAPAAVPDALHALALLLNILSQSDRPLSSIAAALV